MSDPTHERASLTRSPKFGAGIWLGKRLVARIDATVEDSRISPDEPEPRWLRDAMVFVNAVNAAALPSTGLTPDDIFRAMRVADPDLMITREWAERLRAALTPPPSLDALAEAQRSLDYPEGRPWVEATEYHEDWRNRVRPLYERLSALKGVPHE